MAKKKKFYVVWRGNNPGIYDTWEACLAQVSGYPGAKYKSFPSRDEARIAFAQGPRDEETVVQSAKVRGIKNIVQNSICVDGACSGNPGQMEYRGVWTSSGKEIFHQGPFSGGTNNIGEFLALVHALAILKKRKLEETPIYSDSRTAMKWVRDKRANTKIERTAGNMFVFELLTRAENWLKSNDYLNPILKWETEKWGEIPADFGRK